MAKPSASVLENTKGSTARYHNVGYDKKTLQQKTQPSNPPLFLGGTQTENAFQKRCKGAIANGFKKLNHIKERRGRAASPSLVFTLQVDYKTN